MHKPPRHPLRDFHGAVRLAVDGTRGVVDVVESMHGTIQRWTLPVGRPAADTTFGITGFVYRRVKKNIEWIGGGLDRSMQTWVDRVPDAAEGAAGRDVILAALNGVWGDYLEASDNPLALPMTMRVPHTEPKPSNTERGDRLILLAHGLCMDDGAWTTKEGHDHGLGLCEALDLVPLYLQYNSGLSVADNGRSLAGLMEAVVHQWPRPVEQVILLGYSMGGLVIRSACHYAELEGHAWRSKVSRLMTLGTPHLGSPLQRTGTWLDATLEVSPYSAPLARLTRRRSAGIADLGHGNVTETDGQTVPLPDGVRCHALAASRDSGPSSAASNGPSSDGLVPVPSALGQHDEPTRRLEFSERDQAVVYGVSHLGLLGSRQAFERLLSWASEKP